MARLTKQVGYRVSAWTLNGFKGVCSGEGLRPSQAVERFMELAVRRGSVEGLLSAVEVGWMEQAAGNEAKARVLLGWAAKDKWWFGGEDEETFSVEEELYRMLGKIRDQKLVKRIEEALKF